MAISRGIQRLWVKIKLKDNSLNQLGNGKIKSLIVPKTKKLAILILKSKNMKQIFKKEGIMKGVMLVCVILALLVSSPAQSQTLFDDFTGPLLDSSKWYGNYIWVHKHQQSPGNRPGDHERKTGHVQSLPGKYIG